MKYRVTAYILMAIVLLLFHRYGRSIWYPVVLKYKGGKSVTQVITDLESGVAGKFKNWSTLVDGNPIALLAFKEERKIELWKSADKNWLLVKSFPFTAFSGKLGPKLAEGDDQIPEGIYSIEYLNPNSSYHLSMKVSYPNSFDLAKARLESRNNLGGDIFIHGKQATIGCMNNSGDSMSNCNVW